MNLPNKITLFRVILIPVFIVFMLVEAIPNNETWALIVFCVACLSDFIDGRIARKYKMITDFGKLMDPLADKLVVCSALICFVELRDSFACWAAIIIIAREFTISAVRLLAADNGVVIAASKWGKVKTVVQMFMCIAFIWDLDYEWFRITQLSLMYLAVALTVISLVDYIIKNRKIFSNMK
ncbi:MAG: CDP-diacylglycerol--glycerol-3-phosphate 3-phosphatidyltransferase [Lachnospiraceae bacterium]|nr:CDP-diacylglycerol--glycerol-3-phosphate 3-phosphatidyltransferase [Lachnospiraceae bacterium]